MFTNFQNTGQIEQSSRDQGTDIVSLIRLIFPHGRHALHFSGKPALIAYSAASERGESYKERNRKPDYCCLLPNSLRKRKRNDWQREKPQKKGDYRATVTN